MKQLFLISSSRYQGGGFWNHCINSLGSFLGKPEEERKKILFIPFADSDRNYNAYTQIISGCLSGFGYEVIGMHSYGKETSFIEDEKISAICVGGGNTWLLANNPSVIKFRCLIKEKVNSGQWKYISASAGTVMAGESMITTNDMCPLRTVEETRGFELIPFQINPHFVPGEMVAKHMGETREERIRQVINSNPDWQVVGLPEGCWIESFGDGYILQGTGQAVIFRKDGNSVWLPGNVYKN